jgi:tripartite-type tricarboxylate transporter receptor subunit TctC
MNAMNVRRTRLSSVIALGALGCLAAEGRAQTTYPDHVIRIIVPHPAGGSSDTVTRIVADKMQSIWGKPVVLENIVGARGDDRVALAELLAAAFRRGLQKTGYITASSTFSVTSAFATSAMTGGTLYCLQSPARVDELDRPRASLFSG